VPRTPGLLELPGNLPALEAERARLERELAATASPRARLLLALERRRTVIALDAIAAGLSPHEGTER
jgi:hypothetical protein